MAEEDKTKVYFVDTNIIGRNYKYIFDIAKENHVMIIDSVFEELDRHKSDRGSFGMNCRRASSLLYKLTEQADLIKKGYKTWEKGKVFLYGNYNYQESQKLLSAFNPNLGEGDRRLMSAALDYQNKNKNKNVILITMDKNVVTVARSNGLKAELKRGEDVQELNPYQGYRILTSESLYEAIISSEDGTYNSVNFPVELADEEGLEKLVTNEFVIFNLDGKDLHKKTPSREVVFRYSFADKSLKPIKYNYQPILGLKPKNLEQMLALDILMDPTIKIKAIEGYAGTGKTLLALAASLSQVCESRKKMAGSLNPPMIYLTRRSIDVAGEDLGTLPGDMVDKTNLNFLGLIKNYGKISATLAGKKFFEENDLSQSLIQEIRKEIAPHIEILPISKIRGTTLDTNDIFILDEAQNMERRTLKTVGTRIGGGPIIIIGDTSQSDNPNVYEHDGLTAMVDLITKEKDPLFAPRMAALSLLQVERSIECKWFTERF